MNNLIDVNFDDDGKYKSISYIEDGEEILSFIVGDFMVDYYDFIYWGYEHGVEKVTFGPNLLYYIESSPRYEFRKFVEIDGKVYFQEEAGIEAKADDFIPCLANMPKFEDIKKYYDTYVYNKLYIAALQTISKEQKNDIR